MVQIAKGKRYWSAWINDGKVDLTEYEARTVNKNGAYLTAIVPYVTWGRLSNRRGDVGFLPNIPRYAVERVAPGCRHTFRLTKVAAVRARIAWVRRIGHLDQDDRDEIETLKRWLKRNAK